MSERRVSAGCKAQVAVEEVSNDVFTRMFLIGLETCSYRPHEMVTPRPRYCTATADKQTEESKNPKSKNPKSKNPSNQKCMWKRDNSSGCEELQKHVSRCKNTESELKIVPKQELSHVNSNTPQHGGDLALHANEETEVAFDLLHCLVPGDGRRASNGGEEARKWSPSVSLH